MDESETRGVFTDRRRRKMNKELSAINCYKDCNRCFGCYKDTNDDESVNLTLQYFQNQLFAIM